MAGSSSRVDAAPGRFTTAARRASRPRGIDRRDGGFALALTAVEWACVSVIFQAHNLPWGGLVLWAALALQLVALAILTGQIQRVRRVVPRGYGRRWSLAGAWGVAVVLVAGWFWIAGGGHSASPMLTTLAALAAVVPQAVLAARLLRRAG